MSRNGHAAQVTSPPLRHDAEGSRRRRRALATMTLVFLAVVGAGLVIAIGLDSQRQREHQRAVDLEIDRVAAQLQRSIERTTAGLSGAPGIVDRSGVSIDRFYAFAEGISQVDPVIVAALELVVDGPERGAFEAEQGWVIRGDVRAADAAPDRERYFPVVAVYPSDGEADIMIGLDISVDPARGFAAAIASEAGRAVVTPPVELAYTPDPGIIVVQPLFRDGLNDDPVEREAGLVGFVSISYSIDELLAEAIGPATRLRDVQVVDAADDSAGLPDGWTEQSLLIGDRVWLVRGLAADGPTRWVAVAIVGVALLIAALLIEMIRRAWQLEVELALWNDRLRQQQQRLMGLQSLTATLASAATVEQVTSATLDQGLSLVNGVGAEIEIYDDFGQRERLAVGTIAGPHTVGLSRRLMAEGRTVGHLRVAVPIGGEADASEPMLNAVAAMTGHAVGRALRYDTEHEMVRALQSMLLPVLPARSGPISLAARYQPMLSISGVGGDWYDLLDTPNGPAVVIGDVVGKGVRAAGVMGQLRMATRTMADRYDPTAVLSSLDELSTEFRSAFMTSVAYVVLDLAHGELRAAIAGHPPPLLLRGNGEPVWLDTAVGPPLGIAVPARSTIISPFTEGDRLLLYTDGLIERRGERIDDGLDRLYRAACALAHLEPGVFLDELIAQLSPQSEQQDDVAVLCAQYGPASV